MFFLPGSSEARNNLDFYFEFFANKSLKNFFICRPAL
jgi:hypothetical protein